MSWADQHHTILAIISVVVCSALVVWAIVSAYLDGKRRELDKLLAQRKAAQVIAELISSDHKDELKNNTITEEWTI